MSQEKIYETMDKAIVWMRSHKQAVLLSSFLYVVFCFLALFLLINSQSVHPHPGNTKQGLEIMALLAAATVGGIVIMFGLVAQTSYGEEIERKKILLESRFEDEDGKSIIARKKIKSLEKSLLVFRRLNLALADTYFIYPDAPLSWFINVKPCSPEKRRECAGSCPCPGSHSQADNCDFNEMENAIDFTLPDFVVVDKGRRITGAIFVDRTLSRWELYNEMKHKLLNDVLPKAGIRVLNIQTTAIPSVEKIREIFSNPPSDCDEEQGPERDALYRVDTYCPLCGQAHNNKGGYLSDDLKTAGSAAIGPTCCF
jgi:uncharacterized integral membrane protein